MPSSSCSRRRARRNVRLRRLGQSVKIRRFELCESLLQLRDLVAEAVLSPLKNLTLLLACQPVGSCKLDEGVGEPAGDLLCNFGCAILLGQAEAGIDDALATADWLHHGPRDHPYVDVGVQP
jgi:hypothetical protein